MCSCSPVDLSEVISVAWWAAKKPGLKRTSAAWLTDNDRPGCRYVLRSDLWCEHYHRLGPSISSEGSQQRSVAGEQYGDRCNFKKAKKIRREDSKLPWWHVELISHFRVQTVNTLLFSRYSWPEPVTSPWSLIILPWSLAQGCRAGGTARARLCNSQASRSPATAYWFLFPQSPREKQRKD